MRIQATLKKVWKSLEVLANTPPPSAAPAATKPKPNARPESTTSADTFSSSAAVSAKQLTQVQQPLRAAAPRFDNETANKLVESLYRGALGRGLDESGRKSWVPLVEQGRLSEVVEHVLASPEFAGRAATMDTKQLASELYTGMLQRTADPEGHAGTQAAITRGHLAHRVFDMLLSPEHRELMERKPEAPTAPAKPTPPTVPGPTPNLPKEPGAALSTVPMRPEYAKIPIDKSSEAAAAKSAAAWVRANKPEFFDKGKDRAVAYEMMTWVIGALRAHGYDAHRVVNHPSHPMGTGVRYGADAVVMPSRIIYDVFVAWGQPGRGDPVAQNVGNYAEGRLRE